MSQLRQSSYRQSRSTRDACDLWLRRNHRYGESQAKEMEMVQWGKSSVLPWGGLLPL